MVPLRLLSVIAALAVFGAASVAAGQAPSAGVECGDTITTDTTLDRDLTGCPNNGIAIGADGITLDLNGHTISGDGKLVRRCPRRQPCDIGIFNESHDGVTIRNGSLRGFGEGVVLVGVRGNHLERLSSSRNRFFGLALANSARTVIRDCSAHDNPAPDGDGLGVFFSHDLRIVGNSFRRNAEVGMHVKSSRNNLIRDNVFARNAGFGILLEGTGNEVRGNHFSRDRVASIQVGPASRNVLARNRIHGSGEGIAIEKGRGNLVVRNLVVGVRHDGIRLGIWDPPIGSTRTVVRRNLVIDSGRDGYRVAERDRGALLVGNVARRSGDDGFDIDSSTARLMRNRALGSTDLAFERP